MSLDSRSLTPPHGFSSDYWVQSRRPLSSLVFVLPLLVVYEVGVLALGPAAVRNGADAWLRQFLDLIGFGQYFLLPMLIVGVLLAWHHTTRQPWRVGPSVVGGMYAESAVLAGALVGIAHVQGLFFRSAAETLGVSILARAAAPSQGFVANVIGFLGAGIYEELLFRLLLLPIVAGALRLCGVKLDKQIVGAVIITSFLFSAAHYIGPHESWTLFSFVFRFLAGAFFAVLFVVRGFGIAAGTHALFDIFVGAF